MRLKTPATALPAFSLVVAIMGMSLCWSANSQDYIVTKQQFRALNIELGTVKSVETYAGSMLSASVSAISGQAYTISSPMNAQRVTFLKRRGARVEKGEPIVALIGPEVEHYYDEYQLKTDLFAQTAQLYQNNRSLYEKKAIGEQQWLNISEQYITRKLALGEYQHFFEYVEHYSQDDQSLTLTSPMSGVLNYDVFNSLNTAQDIVRIIPDQAIRIKVNLPAGQAHTPSSLKLPNCTLNVDAVEGLSQSFFKTLWSEPLKQACALRYGDIVVVVPQYKISAFLVPKTAVFSFHGKHYVMRQRSEDFAAVEVNIVASEQNNLVVTSTESIHDASIATSSVSALQGILMGLGE
jgi:hypothetical protein